MPPTLSIILVNHNATRLTLDCLQSVQAQTAVAHEIVLVDNASTDDVIRQVRARFPDVHVISNDANRGFAGANNQGLEASRGDFVILLNNDTVLKNPALDRMVAFMQAHADAGALAPKLLDGDGVTVQRNCRAFPSPVGTMFGRSSVLTRLFPNNPMSSRNLLKDFDYNSPREVDWVSGAAIMVTREVLEKAGPLDADRFYMYWDDIDWCRRIRQAGWKVYFTPDAQILHYSGQGGTRLPQLGHNLRMIFYMHRSAYRYFRKHDYPSPVHPVAIATGLGMLGLIAGKSIAEICRHLLAARPGDTAPPRRH